MASHWYNHGLLSVLNGQVSLSADTIKAMLVSPAYTFDPTHKFVSAVVANELGGTGYVGGFGGGGRLTLSGKTFNYDDVANLAYFDANDLLWTSIIAGTAAAAILIKEDTTDGASHLIGMIDMPDVATNGSNLSLTWSASGILRLKYL